MRFEGSFTQQEPLPEAAIRAATEVMSHGRLHRYNLVKGEAGEAALLEKDFAAFTGARFCVAVTSGGYALGTALRALTSKVPRAIDRLARLPGRLTTTRSVGPTAA